MTVGIAVALAWLATLAILVAAPLPVWQGDAVRIGIARLDTAGGCVAIGRHELPAGSQLTFVHVPPVNGPGVPRVIEGAVVSPARRGDTACPAAFGDETDRFYAVRLARPLEQREAVYFAIVAAPAAVTMRAGVPTVTFGKDVAPVSLRSCTSVEGLHLTAWRGPALSSPRLFHAYNYLGYDMQPTCTDRETVSKQPPRDQAWTATFTLLDAGGTISASQLQRLAGGLAKMWRLMRGQPS